MFNTRPKGTKKGYVNPSSEVPETGVFNPMDYIDHADYRMNRRGKLQYEQDLAQIEYLAQLRQQEFALEYQDPVNDVKRQREAGLNPDLVGLSGSTAPSGPAGVSPTGIGGVPSNTDKAMQAFNLIASVSDMTKQFLSGGLQLSNMFMSNIQNEANTISSLFSLQDTADYRNIDLSQVPLSRATKRKLEKLPSSHLGTMHRMKGSSDIYNASSSYMESMAKHWEHTLNPLYNPSGRYDEFGFSQGATPEQWSNIWKPLAEFAYKAFGHSKSSEYSRSKSEDDYWNTTDDNGRSIGAVKADTEIATQTESGNASEFMSNLRQPIREVAKNLKKEADKGSAWANFALIALYFVSQMSFTKNSKGVSFSM